MKYLKSIVLVLLINNIVGCGTVGGAVSGAGTDLQKAGDWIKTR
jgi:hypothetical protein